MVWIFSIGSFFTLASFFVMDTVVDSEIVWLAVYSVPAIFLGWWIGEKVFYRVNQHLFKRIALLAVLLGGSMALISGIKNLL